MNVIMATVGKEPAGIIESVKKFPCDKMVLFAPENEDAKACLSSILSIADAMKIISQIVAVDPYDIIDNINKIKEKVEENRGNHVVLNVTGGRKTLAIAATLAGLVQGDLIDQIIYITEEENEVIRLPRLLNPKALLSEEKRTMLKVMASKGESTAEEVKNNLISDQGITIQTIWKHLRELQALGYIEASGVKPKRYRLTAAGWLMV